MSLVILIMKIKMIIIFNKVMVGANELINQILGATNFIKSLLHCLKPKLPRKTCYKIGKAPFGFSVKMG